MFRFTLSNGLSRGVGLSKGWPLKRVASQKGSNVRIYRNASLLYVINHSKTLFFHILIKLCYLNFSSDYSLLSFF